MGDLELESFRTRTRALAARRGLTDELAALLQEVEAAHAELESLRGQKQGVGLRSAPHKERAESQAARHNDEANTRYRLRDWQGALACYTQATQLHPEEAAYHSNMAAALLHLKLYHAAHEAASRSLKLNASSVRAQARCAAALEGMQDWSAAATIWQLLLSQQPDNTKAISGKSRCEAALAQQATADAAMLSRPALPRVHHDENQAANELAQAQQLITACPGNLAARFHVVESLILCGRLDDAGDALLRLPAGQDRAYLAAEISVRGGHAADACKHLAPWTDGCGDSTSDKCAHLLSLASHLHALITAAEKLLQDGEHLACGGATSTALQWAKQHLPHPGVMQRLQLIKAEALLGTSGGEGAALQSLASTEGLTPLPRALWLHAQALMKCGKPHEAYCKLLELQSCSPEYPGISQAVRAAADAALRYQQQQHVHQPTGVRVQAVATPRVQQCCELLLLSVECWCRGEVTRAQLDSAYRRQAAYWHPDRAVAGGKSRTSDDAQHNTRSAETQFIHVRQAYDHLLEQLGCTDKARCTQQSY